MNSLLELSIQKEGDHTCTALVEPQTAPSVPSEEVQAAPKTKAPKKAATKAPKAEVTPKPVEETMPFKEIVEKLQVEESQSHALKLVRFYFQCEDRSSEKSSEIMNHLLKKSILTSGSLDSRDIARVGELVKDLDPMGLDSLKKATSGIVTTSISFIFFPSLWKAFFNITFGRGKRRTPP